MTVRTKSRDNQSSDSNPVLIPGAKNKSPHHHHHHHHKVNNLLLLAKIIIMTFIWFNKYYLFILLKLIKKNVKEVIICTCFDIQYYVQKCIPNQIMLSTV